MATKGGDVLLDRTHAADLNLAVLQQRLDPAIESIAASASHAVVYVLDDKIKLWVRRGSGKTRRRGLR